MMPFAPFILGALGIMDGFSTYYSLKYQKMLFPKIAQHKGEKGLTAHYFINKYGVKIGLICNYFLVPNSRYTEACSAFIFKSSLLLLFLNKSAKLLIKVQNGIKVQVDE